MGLKKLFIASLLCGLVDLAQPQRLQPQETASPQAAEQLLNELPRCSILRDQLALGPPDSGSLKTYMQAMRREGVRRIMFEVESVWHAHKARNLRITRKLYFANYDGPHSQITDAERVQEIESSEMERVVEQVVLERAASAGPLHCVDCLRSLFKDGDLGYCPVELFDDGRFREVWPRIFPLPKPVSGLIRAAASGDEVALKQILQSAPPSHAQLNMALIAAAASRYDNS